MRRKRAINADELALAIDQPGVHFDVAEAAAVLRLSVAKIHGLIKAGHLDGCRLPGAHKVLVPRKAIRDYLDRGRRPVTAAAS